MVLLKALLCMTMLVVLLLVTNMQTVLLVGQRRWLYYPDAD